MIVYNVTVKVDHTIAADWLNWLKNEHITDIINTGCFIKATIYHLTEIEEDDGITYVVQYHAKTREDYDNYISQHANAMRKKATEKWQEKFIAFRSVMELVN